MDGPLAGIRVIEVANWLAAPAGAALLADMGADRRSLAILPPERGWLQRRFRHELGVPGR
jgi:crotonobetainyl-CoA:carnitine CoA-transferase CaiB-like acyl-CoA transferase